MWRRVFLAAAGSVIAFPSAASAQQTIPTIGLLSSRSPDESSQQIVALRRGLSAFGFVDGKSARVIERWAYGDYRHLGALALELVALRPNVIVAVGGTPTAQAAKKATNEIPVLFHTSEVMTNGLVDSLNRPGSNVTGVDHMSGELLGKRIELITELVVGASKIGFLANPENPAAEKAISDFEKAGQRVGRQLLVERVIPPGGINQGLVALKEQGVDAIVVRHDAAFDSHRADLIQTTAAIELPAIYHIREFPADGGLMSYGPNFIDTYYQLGVQAGRILKGATVSELPVVRPTRLELVINTRAAAQLGLRISPAMIAQADEVLD